MPWRESRMPAGKNRRPIDSSGTESRTQSPPMGACVPFFELSWVLYLTFRSGYVVTQIVRDFVIRGKLVFELRNERDPNQAWI